MDLNYLKKIIFILGDEKKITHHTNFFIFLSLELLGLALLGPYISLITSDHFEKNTIYQFILNLINLEKHDKLFLIKIFGIALILIFIFKSFISILINYIIINFTLNLELYLRSKLTYCYQNMPYKLFVTKNSSHVIYSILNLAGNFSGGVVQLILKMISDCIISLAIIVFWQ